MGRRLICVYGEDEDILQAKALGINISQELRNFLSIKIANKDINAIQNEKEKIAILEMKLTEMKTLNENLIKERDSIQRKLHQIQEQNLEFKKKSKLKLIEEFK